MLCALRVQVIYISIHINVHIYTYICTNVGLRNNDTLINLFSWDWIKFREVYPLGSMCFNYKIPKKKTRVNKGFLSYEEPFFRNGKPNHSISPLGPIQSYRPQFHSVAISVDLSSYSSICPLSIIINFNAFSIFYPHRTQA